MRAKKDLDEYRKRRNFERTSEPDGVRRGSRVGPIFVVQKHAARTLHYDFRIEIDGVLKSWAVPKGPSRSPSERRLAVPTEDHPIDYADFEGKIPEGEYGAGTVMIWDEGTYENLRLAKEGDGASMGKALAQGRIEISLTGSKLTGGYALIRTGGGRDPRWLLVKMKDGEARPGSDITAERPESARTGRTIEEIGGD